MHSKKEFRKRICKITYIYAEDNWVDDMELLHMYQYSMNCINQHTSDTNQIDVLMIMQSKNQLLHGLVQIQQTLSMVSFHKYWSL
jgi:hypothetical protein